MDFVNSLNQFLKMNDGIIDFLSMAATFSAVVVSLKIARQSITAKLVVSLNTHPTTAQIMYPSSSGDVPEIPDLEIVLHNIGNPDIYIRRSSFHWRLPFPFKFSVPLFMRQSHPMADPTCIKTGASFSVELDTVDWNIKGMLDNSNFPKSKWLQKLIYLEVVTDSRKTFKAAVPGAIKKAIIYHYDH